MKTIVTVLIVFALNTLYCQANFHWTLGEISKSIEDKNIFIEHLIIEKNYRDITSDYDRSQSVLRFANGEQAVWIYERSIQFFFNPKNSNNYDEIIDKIKSSGVRIGFSQMDIRGETMWVLIYKMKSNYFFICKDSVNNRFIEISESEKI